MNKVTGTIRYNLKNYKTKTKAKRTHEILTMFCLSSALRKTFANKGIINYIRQTPAHFHTASLLLRQEIDDQLAVQSVEENLFENNERHGKFVSKRELLELYKPDRKQSIKSNKPPKSNDPTKQIASNKPPKSNDPTKQLAIKIASTQKKAVNDTRPEVIVDEDIGFHYTKLQRRDRTFQQLMLTVKSKKHRQIKHQLLLEGRRLILDAINCGLPLKYLIFSDIEQLKLVAKVAPKDVTCYKVSEGDLSFWSTLTTCPGLMAIAEKPDDMSHIWKQENPLPIIVICDQVREPNNVGSIIRACAALPVEKIILTKGCADPWDTKALRGGAGSQFVIPTMGPMDWNSILSTLPPSYNVLVAENNPANAEIFLGARNMDKFVPYTDIPKSEAFVIVIGGETEGVSHEAYELLKMDRDGCCVHIPLANGIDSLNTSTALAVILFEIRKRIKTERITNE